jgi:hypothetical protein
MTKRVTVSLPDDVAEYLNGAENASATVANALRAQMDRGAATEAVLLAMGYRITQEGRQRWRERLKPLTPEQKAEIQRRWELVRSGNWPADASTDAA